MARPCEAEESLSRALRGIDRAVDDIAASAAGPAFADRFAVAAFNMSLDAVIVTMFVSGVHARTLPMTISNAVLHEITPILSAARNIAPCDTAFRSWRFGTPEAN